MKIPACALNHRHPLVRAVREQAERIWLNRRHLDRPVVGRGGEVVVPPLKDFFGAEARRSDGVETLLGTLLVQLCWTDYKSKWILEKDGRHAKHDPFLSLRRTAIEAGFVPDAYSRDPGDKVERALHWERKIGLVSFTKHRRTKEVVRDDQGNVRVVKTSKASMRRLKFAVLAELGPSVAVACYRADKKAREDQTRRDDRFRKAVDAMNAAPPAPELPAADPLAPAPRAPGAPDPLICDAVAEDHPDWTPPQIFAEARRRESLLADTS